MNTINGNVIIFGLEAVVQIFIKEPNPTGSFRNWLMQWLLWEVKTTNSRLILIGTDIGKGIVPIDKESRLYRDTVGWCFQDVAQQANRVDVIWYGLNEQLK